MAPTLAIEALDHEGVGPGVEAVPPEPVDDTPGRPEMVELVANDRLAQIVVLVVGVHKRPVVDALLAFAKGVVKPSHEREVVTPGILVANP